MDGEYDDASFYNENARQVPDIRIPPGEPQFFRRHQLQQQELEQQEEHRRRQQAQQQQQQQPPRAGMTGFKSNLMEGASINATFPTTATEGLVGFDVKTVSQTQITVDFTGGASGRRGNGGPSNSN